MTWIPRRLFEGAAFAEGCSCRWSLIQCVLLFVVAFSCIQPFVHSSYSRAIPTVPEFPYVPLSWLRFCALSRWQWLLCNENLLPSVAKNSIEHRKPDGFGQSAGLRSIHSTWPPLLGKF